MPATLKNRSSSLRMHGPTKAGRELDVITAQLVGGLRDWLVSAHGLQDSFRITKSMLGRYPEPEDVMPLLRSRFVV